MAASKKEDPRAGPKPAASSSDHVRKGSGFRRAVQIPEDAFPENEEPTAETDLAQLEHERALRALSENRSPPPKVAYEALADDDHDDDDYPNAHDDSSAWDAITSKTDLADEVTKAAPEPPSSAKLMAAPVAAPPVPYRPPAPSTPKSLPAPTPPPPRAAPPPSSGHLRALEVDVDSLAKAAQGHVLPRPPTPLGGAMITTPPMPMPMHSLRNPASPVKEPAVRPPIETLPLDESSMTPSQPMVSEREMLSLPFLPPPVVRRAFIAALQAQAPPPPKSPWLTFFVVLVSVIALAAIAYLVLVLTGHRPSLLIH